MTEPLDVKACRKVLGLSQLKLARILGVTDKSVMRWERGMTIKRRHRTVHPRKEYVLKIQALLQAKAEGTQPPMVAPTFVHL